LDRGQSRAFPDETCGLLVLGLDVDQRLVLGPERACGVRLFDLLLDKRGLLVPTLRGQVSQLGLRQSDLRVLVLCLLQRVVGLGVQVLDRLLGLLVELRQLLERVVFLLLGLLERLRCLGLVLGTRKKLPLLEWTNDTQKFYKEMPRPLKTKILN
jgi:hypothetical protein